MKTLNSDTIIPRTRVKICGITRPQDAIVAAKLGTDAIGLVFYDKSPRAVSIEQALNILADLPAFVTVTGLFVNPTSTFVNEILAKIPLDILQFHGEESPEACLCYHKPYIKAIRMHPEIDLAVEIKRYASARSILLDTYVKQVKGGTGLTFDWQKVPPNLAKSLIIAGGLTPKNVTKAITTLHPYAVDVSGGVEIDKGIKSEEKMTAFITGVSYVKYTN